MKIDEVTPVADSAEWLAGAQFADAFRLGVAGTALDARTAAQRMMGRSPRWVEALLALRHALVKPFGLKASGERPGADLIGIFPVLRETPQRLVAGFDDHHLDFRVVVDVATSGEGQSVTVTTLVLTHNRLGRCYLAVILPFHRLVVRTLLRQVAA